MIIINKILSAGGGCPYQFEGITDDGRYVYLRYRGGFLRAGISPTERDFAHDWDSYNIISECIGHPLDGIASHDLFMEKLDGKLTFPEGFKFDSFSYVDNRPPSDYDEELTESDEQLKKLFEENGN